MNTQMLSEQTVDFEEPPAGEVQSPESNGQSLPELLSPSEAAELSICDGIIERGLKSFIEVGLALATVRDKRLYRVSFDTFEGYVEAKCPYGVRQAHRVIASAVLAQSIADQAEKVAPGSHLIVPKERQARALGRLPADEREPAWREALTIAATRPNGEPTVKEVERVVAARLGLSPESKVQSPKPAAQQPVIEAVPAGNREQRAREALRGAIAAVRGLVDALGTADSLVAARAGLTLEQLDGIGAHLARMERMQVSRA